jgi:hypothetical protein
VTGSPSQSLGSLALVAFFIVSLVVGVPTGSSFFSIVVGSVFLEGSAGLLFFLK